MSNVCPSDESSDSSPHVLKAHIERPAPDRHDGRSRTKTRRAAPVPPRSQSLTREDGNKRISKQASTDSESHVSSYLDLPSLKTKRRSQSPAAKDRSRLQAIRNDLSTPKNLRKNSKRLPRKGSPVIVKARAPHFVAENYTFGILSEPFNENSDFQIERIVEYGPYLENLLAKVDESSPDYIPLKDALDRVNAVIRLGQNDNGEDSMVNEGTADISDQKPNSPNRVSAIYFKHLSSGSKFRTGPQSMGLYGTEGAPDQDRKFIMEGSVQLTMGQAVQNRHIFLLSDCLIIAKEKSSSTFKCKHKVKLSDLQMWVAAGTQNNTMNSPISSDKSFVLGWAQNHMVAGFENSSTKDLWIEKITQQQELYAQQNKTPKKQETDSEEESEMDGSSKTKSKKFPMRLFNKRNRDVNRNSIEERPTAKIFGRELQEVCTEDKEPHRHILTILDILFRDAPHTAGIFRKSANARVCREIKKEIEDDNTQNLENHNVLAIGSVLKDYLRSLPNSLMCDELFNEWTGIGDLTNEEEQIKGVKQLILERLPLCHLTLLRYVVAVACATAMKSEINKMDAHNIAVCIAPSMLKNDDETKILKTICVTEVMIKYAREIFGDNIFTRFNSLAHHDSDSDASMGDPLVRREGSSSVDSLVDISDGQADDEHNSVTRRYSRRVLYERNASSTDSGLYSQSVESTSSMDVHEPVPPPRKRKDFQSSSSFDILYNYPKPNLSNYKTDLGKRLSGDSLKSVEEAVEESSYSHSIKYRETASSRLSPRDKIVHHQSDAEITPPPSPRLNSAYCSSRQSFTSESSRSFDSLSLQYPDDDSYETASLSFENSKSDKGSHSGSSTIEINCNTSLPRHESSPSPSSHSSSSPIPIQSRHSFPFNADSKYLSPPLISVTHCVSTSKDNEFHSETLQENTSYQKVKRSSSCERPARERVTVISRRHPSPFINKYMDDLTIRGREERPMNPPSYKEAITRKKMYEQPEISYQDLTKQMLDSERARELYEQSLMAYNSQVSGDRKTTTTVDDDVYVTLTRDPKQVYEDSISKFEKSRNAHQHNQNSKSAPSSPPPYNVAITNTTSYDYTRPEATQTLVNKSPPIIKSSTASVVKRSSSSVTKTSKIQHHQSRASDLPWSVSRMREKFDDGTEPNQRSPPPYQHPPPFQHPASFKRSSDSMSMSSNSSVTSTVFSRSGPQTIDYSFSSEDLNTSGSFSTYHEDSADNNSDHNYTDVSYV